jgi:hypothetical protein
MKSSKVIGITKPVIKLISEKNRPSHKGVYFFVVIPLTAAKDHSSWKHFVLDLSAKNP